MAVGAASRGSRFKKVDSDHRRKPARIAGGRDPAQVLLAREGRTNLSANFSAWFWMRVSPTGAVSTKLNDPRSDGIVTGPLQCGADIERTESVSIVPA